MKKLSEKDAAYLAGLVDGEGCISVQRCGGRGYSSRVSIANTNVALLNWIKRTVGEGALCKAHTNSLPSGYKQGWEWRIYAENASKFLNQILPSLRIKRRQANNQILFQESKIGYKFGRHLTEQERKSHYNFYLISRKLNKKGV